MLFSGVKCAGPGTVHKGRVTPILDEYFYRDYIFMRCDTGYKLMMVRKSLFCFKIIQHLLYAQSLTQG